MVQHKERIPVAVVVVKSRLLDVAKSLETTPEENLLMARETIAYLHDNGLEVIVDLEHALDAFCGRRENGEACEADFSQAKPGVLPPDGGAVRGAEGEPAFSATRRAAPARRRLGGCLRA